MQEWENFIEGRDAIQTLLAGLVDSIPIKDDLMRSAVSYPSYCMKLSLGPEEEHSWESRMDLMCCASSPRETQPVICSSSIIIPLVKYPQPAGDVREILDDLKSFGECSDVEETAHDQNAWTGEQGNFLTFQTQCMDVFKRDAEHQVELYLNALQKARGK